MLRGSFFYLICSKCIPFTCKDAALKIQSSFPNVLIGHRLESGRSDGISDAVISSVSMETFDLVHFLKTVMYLFCIIKIASLLFSLNKAFSFSKSASTASIRLSSIEKRLPNCILVQC